MNTPPVALLIFRRPELTRRVFAEIARARPPKLLVVADGASPHRPEEAELCQAARDVVRDVDWECDVQTNFSETNMGCGERISSGLDWVFSKVTEAVILEDDCLPHPAFFPFCSEMLNRYRHSDRVMHISGTSLVEREPFDTGSYVFSRQCMVWGWATWRRAWLKHDHRMQCWSSRRRRFSFLYRQMPHAGVARLWCGELDRLAAAAQRGAPLHTWDYQWAHTLFKHEGLGIFPRENLISNNGCGVGDTHCSATHALANRPFGEMSFPLVHPDSIHPDKRYDRRFVNGALASCLPPAESPWRRLRQAFAACLPGNVKLALRSVASRLSE